MMNQADLFRKLGSILNELNDQYEYLAQNPQKFNELELELFLANASFLADHIQIIRKLNNTTVPRELPEHTLTEDAKAPVTSMSAGANINFTPAEDQAIAESAEPAQIEEKKTFSPEHEPLSFEFILNDRPQAESAELPQINEVETQEPVFSAQSSVPSEQPEQAAREDLRPSMTDDPQSREEESPLRDEVGPEPFLVPKEEDKVQPPTTSLIVDEVEEKVVKPTLNDLLASTRKREDAEPIVSAGPPIKDLKQAINLNDKLLYIKDLFNGYNLAYSEAIELVNKMPDFKTADAFLNNNYAAKNNWAAKPRTVDKFYELLRRRFQ